MNMNFKMFFIYNILKYIYFLFFILFYISISKQYEIIYIYFFHFKLKKI